MSFVTDTWRQLVRRRLWPVALLLLAALAAVPVMLAKEPETPSAPVAPASSSRANTTLTKDTASIVSLANGEEARRRHVLGASKDPFEPGPAPKVKAQDTPDAGSGTGSDVTAANPDSPTGPTGGSTPPAGLTPVTPTPVVPPVNKPNYPLYTLTVRFGDSAADALPSSKVTRLEALPSTDEPALVYLGVSNGGKAAVFMLDANVSPQGDGHCEPTPESCETLTMREGDTEFFDVRNDAGTVGAQYQLDLVDIKTRVTASAAKARKAYARHSKAGAKAVRARAATGGPLRYRYNARKGTLDHLSIKAAWKAATARAAALARSSF